MNPTFCALATAGFLCALRPASLAQGSADVPPSSGPRRTAPPRLAYRGIAAPQRNLAPLLEVLDVNHDGILDPEEIANAASALETLDRNDDGLLTLEEYSVPAQGGRPAGRFGPPRFPSRRTEPSTSEGGLGNFALVDGHVCRGAQPGPAGIQTLRELGVTSIVDLTLPDKVGDAERVEAARLGMLYLNFPMDPLARPSSDQVHATLGAITNSVGRVFVHCRAGRDRTGTIIACYRIAQCGWDLDAALSEANHFRMAATAMPMRRFVADFAKACGRPAPDSDEDDE